ncbi:MAG: transporter substrate-binding domain-containing protein [Eubacteriales bacterium]|nr:transporter substrate-binding domain-containing protein [Eubacteriales bacterium]
MGKNSMYDPYLKSFDKKRFKNHQKSPGAAILLLAVGLFLCLLCPLAPQAAEASDEKITLRVGFFEFDGYHHQDEEGNRSGYGYDFLQMIAPYGNFEYEYVGYDKSWAEMQQMLINGEIDLVTSAHKTPDRERLFDFSRKSIGSSYTILTTRPENTEYSTEDYSTLEGIRVGLLEGNSRNDSFASYAETHGFTYYPVYYQDQDQMQEALSQGEDIDAMVTSSLRTLGDREVVIDKFDEAKFYVIVKEGNTQLMDRINSAISRLVIDVPGWIVNLSNKYYNRALHGKKLSLTMEERRYVEDLTANNEKLKILVNPDLAPYSYFDDGVPKGIMVDLLAMAAENAGFPYEIIETASTQEYFDTIRSGKADVVFDATFDYGTAEKAGYYLTSPYYSLTYACVTRSSDPHKKDTVALKTSDKVFPDRYSSLYQGRKLLPCDTMDQCIQAVRNKEADCTYVCTYIAAKYVSADYTNSFVYEIMDDISCPVTAAIRRDCPKFLYSLMNKVLGSINEEQRQTAINSNNQYRQEENAFLYFIYDEPIMVIMTASAVMGGILLLVLLFRRREKAADKRHRETDARQRDALREAYEAADRANHAKSDFLSSMSHDIRTPLNAIIGMTAIASAHKNEPARVSDCLDKITASSRHLLGLINEILDMSKIESGKVTLSNEEFNLANLLDNLVELVQPGIKAKGHELIVRIHHIQHEDVIGDSLRIQEAFVNIVGNATKYTPNGGRIEIEVSELDSGNPKIGAYQFIFRDNGIGMSKEYVKNIFEPFSREESTRINKVQGTGLGMAITKNIVQMMDGSIEVESEQGKGSAFTVVIRLRLQDKVPAKLEHLKGLPVLVVDDDQSICESTCLMLNELGMKSEFVLSGGEAIAKVAESHAKNNDYYAVIIDWKMPGMDGLATTKTIRKTIESDVPIIIFSAYDWSDIEDEARAAGVQAFVSKALFRSRLIRIFDEITQNSQPKEELSALDRFSQMDYSSKHLLLVEDHELNREIACEIIGMTNIQIDIAENGAIAVQKFTSSPHGYYDLILMDIQMPVMNGYEASLSIRSLDRPDAKSVPIIAMTADAFAEDVEKAAAAQMNEHMSKPLDIPKLANVMTRWIPL